MKYLRLLLCICLTFICPAQGFARYTIGRIKDPDGFTNLRKGAGVQFSVVQKLDSNVFIDCKTTDADWWKIQVSGTNIIGYIHKSRIELIDTLPLDEQKKAIVGILKKFKWYQDKMKIDYTFDKDFHTFYDTKYEPILDIIPAYFCKANDSSLLQLFFENIDLQYGSADEMLSFTLGDYYVHQPELFLRQLRKYSKRASVTNIADSTEWGLLNAFGPEADENGKSNNKQFLKLHKDLANIPY